MMSTDCCKCDIDPVKAVVVAVCAPSWAFLSHYQWNFVAAA
ncbi:MAG: hypothetical protein ACLT98_10610 [Eggerthellaceae bacterium]